jgi:thiol-disulfide isomerase/thioredoxin
VPQTVQFITAEPGDAVQVVAQQLARSKAAQRRLLVYVSAPWCEPCRMFHQAVDRGELTGKLGPLDLLAFDAEADAERLLIGGYESRFIPCFAVPGADGKGTGRQIEGSVKGDGAVADLVPRLLPLLQPAPL